MRIAVLSDVHSNLEALDAVLARARDEGAGSVLVLGDIVGYGADPVAVLDRLGDAGASTIAGNHDLAAVGRFDPVWFNSAAAHAIRWTAEVLRDDQRETLRALEPIAETPSATLVHGSILEPATEYVTTEEAAQRSFDAAPFSVCFFGHTHVPAVYVASDRSVRGGTIADGERVRLGTGDGRRYMVNPGSVGQPRDGDPRASFLLWDEDGAEVTLHRVRYDVAAAQEKIRAAGLPQALADRLSVGH